MRVTEGGILQVEVGRTEGVGVEVSWMAGVVGVT
jgi:hypothetical protein